MADIHMRPPQGVSRDRLWDEYNVRKEIDPSRGLNRAVSNHPPFGVERLGERMQSQPPRTPVSASTAMDDVRYAPMYDRDPYVRRPEHAQRLSLEKLPPLSSILGASPSASTPHQSHRANPLPLSERTASETSYYSRSASHPNSSHHQYEGAPAPSPNIDRVTQPTPSQLRPGEPGYASTPTQYYGSRYSPTHPSQTMPPSAHTKWAPQSEPLHQSYFPTAARDTSSSFQRQVDQHYAGSAPPFAKEPDSRPYQELYPNPSPTGPYHPSATNVAPEPVTTKDGLGPKIWTGTQFLPRFVRQAEVPGEGLCYFYDDGTHCKSHIDGEPVNAFWGVTKAGKPRKRLAIACITCREKKIKCDPDYPRCTQCEKFGRICKFKNAPRGGQGSPETSSLDPSEQTVEQSFADDEPVPMELTAQSSTVTPARRNLTLEADRSSSKRMKQSHAAEANGNQEPKPGLHTLRPQPSAGSPTRPTSAQLVKQLTVNPMQTERELAVKFLNLFFVHMGTSGSYAMVPGQVFMNWAEDDDIRKTPDDLMLIYTMLAMGTVFSSEKADKERGEDFAAVSRYSCDQRNYSIQLVQSRLILSLYYYGIGRQTDCWDFAGSALRAASYMKLNVEPRDVDSMSPDEIPFGLNRDGYAECRRRTFWACFVFDCFSGFCQGVPSALDQRDIFLRVPCDETSFRNQVKTKNPYYHPLKPPKGLKTLGPSSYLVNIASLWDDVMANVYRTTRRQDSGEDDAEETLDNFKSLAERLENWHSAIPDCLVYDSETFERAVKKGTLGTYITIHSLYHTSQMNLNRYIRPSLLPADQLEVNIRTATAHAEAVLQMANDLATRTIPEFEKTGSQALIIYSTPFVANAIFCAIDILSAKGRVSSLEQYPVKVKGAMALITHLAQFWQPLKCLQSALNTRNTKLVTGPNGWSGMLRQQADAMARNGNTDSNETMVDGKGTRKYAIKPGAGKGVYAMHEPILPGLAGQDDCLYGVDIEVWEKALEKLCI